jgi:hypothetical protein
MSGKPRRRLLVDPRLQSEIIGSFLAVFVPATVVMGAINWGVLLEIEGLAQALGMPAGHPFYERIAQLRVATTAAMIVTLVGVTALVVYGGLVRTRRIAGPILALRRQLERAAQGEGGTELHVRDGDYFADLQTGINRLIREDGRAERG